MSQDSQEVSKEAVLAELNAATAGPALARAPQLQAMLRYLVTETLAGRGAQIKAYNIAVDVLGRGPDFDAAQDTIVRVQAGRLRTALAQHYAGPGLSSPLRIELGKGSYVPRFLPAVSPPSPADPRANIHLPLGGASSRPAADPAPVAESPVARYGLVSLLALLLGLGLALALSWRTPRPAPPAARELAPPPELKTNRLVVAPFSHLSKSADQQALADALTAEVTSSLARPGLVDLALISARDVGKGENLRLAAEKLGGRWAVTGVLHQSGTRLRANIFLMDVSNGGLVWSQDYERESIGLVPEALTDAILLDLRPQLYWSAKRVLEAKPRPTAHELFVLSTWSPGPETNTLAWQTGQIELARRAVASDPGFGPAHSVLADKLSLLASLLPSFDTPAIWGEADAVAGKALLLAPASSEVAFNLALYHLHAGRLDDAERFVARTLELSPRHTVARFWTPILRYYCSAPPKSVVDDLEVYDRSLATSNPARWQTQIWLARFHLNAGDLDAAAEAARRSMQISPNLGAAIILATALAGQGRAEEARKVMAQQSAYWEGFSFRHFVTVGLPRSCRTAASPEAVLRPYRDALAVLR